MSTSTQNMSAHPFVSLLSLLGNGRPYSSHGQQLISHTQDDDLTFPSRGLWAGDAVVSSGKTHDKVTVFSQ